MSSFDVTDALSLAARHDLHLSADDVTVNEAGLDYRVVLASDDTDHFVGGLFAMVPPLLRAAPEVARAFKVGGGVRFEDFGADCVSAATESLPPTTDVAR